MVNITTASLTRPHYLSTLKEIAQEGVCPFCPKTMHWHTKPILKRYRGWLITENMNLYPNAQYHFLAIGESHKEHLGALTLHDWSAITYLFNWTIKKFRIKGGAIAMRFGEPAYTGASVRHLHAHLISPDIKRKSQKPVLFGIG